MTPASPKLRSPLKWHGGKGYLARRIVECLPSHGTYVEPFAGGLNVLLNKPRCKVEVAGDLDVGLVNFWRQLQARSDEFERTLSRSSYTRQVFDSAAELLSYHVPGDYECLTEAGYAAAFLVRNRFSRGGLGKDFAWSDRLRGGQPGDANVWDTIRAELPAIAARVRDVGFHCRAALDLIHDHDAPGTLFYLDPPYLPATRTARKAYAHEMTRAEHERLVDELTGLDGTWFLSGYRSGLYDEAAALGRWHRIQWDMPNHSGQGKSKQRRVETMWSNRPFPGSVPCEAEPYALGA